MEYLIQLGIQGLKRILTNRKFTTSQKVQDELDEFEESNNPIIGFFKECQNEDFEFENEPTSKVYRRYQEFCVANSLTPLSNGEFSKQVKKYFDFVIVDKKIQGKKYRIFVKE
jgi:putative DNA primase/helicase